MSSFGGFPTKTVQCDYLESSKIVRAKSVHIDDNLKVKSLTLLDEKLTEQQLRNLVEHSKITSQEYVSGSFNGMTIDEMNSMKASVSTLQTGVSNHTTRLDGHDIALSGLSAINDTIDSINVEIQSLQASSNSFPLSILGNLEDNLPLNTTLSQKLGNFRTSNVQTIADALSQHSSNISNIDTTLSDLTDNRLGQIVNTGAGGTNVPVGRTLMESIGDLTFFDSQNGSLVSNHNILRSKSDQHDTDIDNLQQTISGLDHTGIQNIQNAVSNLGTIDITSSKIDKSTMVEVIGDLTEYSIDVNDQNGFTRDGWYPLFTSSSQATDWIDSNINDHIYDILNSGLTATPADYNNLLAEMNKFTVVSIGPPGTTSGASTHVTLTAPWSGAENASDVYYTVMYNNGTLGAYNGNLSYLTTNGTKTRSTEKTYIGSGSTFPSNPKKYDLISDVQTLTQKIGEVLRILGPTELVDGTIVDTLRQNTPSTQSSSTHCNEMSSFLYSCLRSGSTSFMSSGFLRPSYNTGRFLCGLVSSVDIDLITPSNVFSLPTYNEKNDFIDTLKNSNLTAHLIFMFNIHSIENDYNTELRFYIHPDQDTYFSINLHYSSSQSHVIDMGCGVNATSIYDSSAFTPSTVGYNPRSNPVTFIQLKYNTGSGFERFTDLGVSRGILEAPNTYKDTTYAGVDKNFIFDWIKSPQKRLHVINNNSSKPATTAYLDGMCVITA